jgi:membrane protein required for colicin V production
VVLPHVLPYLPQTALREVMLFVLMVVVSAVVLGILAQMLVSAMFGPAISFGDRVAGLALGLVRALLVAILLVLMFERFMPANRQPAFLQGSKARPMLSMLAAHGLRSLPPQVQWSIDKLRNALVQPR